MPKTLELSGVDDFVFVSIRSLKSKTEIPLVLLNVFVFDLKQLFATLLLCPGDFSSVEVCSAADGLAFSVLFPLTAVSDLRTLSILTPIIAAIETALSFIGNGTICLHFGQVFFVS